jgi:parallel beta-helix repeat protein
MKRSVISLMLLLLCAGYALAGSLNPPGSPAPTGKILPEVEPRIAINANNTPGDATSVYRITHPGSYYLTANIVGPIGKNGITIASNDVVIDLNGFNMLGMAGSLTGIAVSGSTNSIIIRNGTVNGWGGDGINLCDTVGYNNRDHVVEGVIVHDNGGSGIRILMEGLITNCVAAHNGENGIQTDRACVIQSCSVRYNLKFGIQTSTGCVITDVSCRDNNLVGIWAGTFNHVERCVVFGGTGSGITIDSGMVVGCTVQQCGQTGIRSIYSSTITNNVLAYNAGDGILVASACIVTRNNCRSSGHETSELASGIRTTGGDNRIEYNNCILNDYGIRVEGTGSIILGNTCSGNSTLNYSIVAGNRYGPIINLTAGGTAAASGNSATSTLASTDPWANFAY